MEALEKDLLEEKLVIYNTDQRVNLLVILLPQGLKTNRYKSV
jgi:hypothetical protein